MAEVRERRAYSTADTYSSCLTNQVLPQLGEPGSSSVMSPSSTRSSPAWSGPGEPSSSTTAQPPRSCATPPTPAARSADKIAAGADLPALIRFAVGSGPRIGELCAVRWMISGERAPCPPHRAARQAVPAARLRQWVGNLQDKKVARLVPLPANVYATDRSGNRGIAPPSNYSSANGPLVRRADRRAGELK